MAIRGSRSVGINKIINRKRPLDLSGIQPVLKDRSIKIIHKEVEASSTKDLMFDRIVDRRDSCKTIRTNLRRSKRCDEVIQLYENSMEPQKYNWYLKPKTVKSSFRQSLRTSSRPQLRISKNTSLNTAVNKENPYDLHTDHSRN